MKVRFLDAPSGIGLLSWCGCCCGGGDDGDDGDDGVNGVVMLLLWSLLLIIRTT